jgi:hypothetical protein
MNSAVKQERRDPLAVLDMVLPTGLRFDQIKQRLYSLAHDWVLVGTLMCKGLFQRVLQKTTTRFRDID